MKTKILISAVLLFVGLTTIQAQTRATKETKVVLIVNEKTNLVTNIATHASFGVEREMKEKFPNSRFYLGLLKGNYENKFGGPVIGTVIGSTIIIYTNKSLFSGDNFLSHDYFSPGDNFKLGRGNSKVISSKKGELMVQVN